MIGAALQALAVLAAFWLGLFELTRRGVDPGELLRFAVGLVLGALLARVGWVALHPLAFGADPFLLLRLDSGFTLLAVPAGPLLASGRRLARGRREVPALCGLPLAFAIARLGCVAAGCCTGVLTYLPHAIEVTGFACLHRCARGAPPVTAPALVLLGFGSIRLLSLLARTEPAVGTPQHAALGLGALCWVSLGAAWWVRARTSGEVAAAQGLASGRQSSSSGSRPRPPHTTAFWP